MGRSAANSLQKAAVDHDEPPYCVSPNPQKLLLLYLATNLYTIGALIAQEDGVGIKQPMYYINRALKDAKTRYPRVERACLAIVYASQRLRHYFLAYKVWLMTKSHAVKVLLWQPILFGKISSGYYNCHNTT